MDESTLNSVYNASYYDRYGHNKEPYQVNLAVINTLNKLADMLVKKYKPKTHIDYGCAMGHLVAAMRKRGVESFGIDASRYAIDNCVVPARRYVSCENILNVAVPEQDQYSIATCIEVAEHLEPEHENTILDIICGSAPIVFFSSEDNKSDLTHLNAHPQSYWKARFLDRGFISEKLVFPFIPWGNFFVRAESYDALKNLLDAETRVTILERDKFSCVLCGAQGVQVHEILPRSAFGKSTMSMCYAEKNRACLCVACHEQAHTRQERTRLITTMQAKYGYSYSEQEYQKYGEFK